MASSTGNDNDTPLAQAEAAATLSSAEFALVQDGKKGKVGVFSTALGITCQMAGMGILQLAYMLRQGGWLCIALIIICALSTNYTGKILIRCCYKEDERLYGSYAEIAFAAFGKTGQFVTQAFEDANLFGVSALFLILGGKFLEELFPNTLDTRAWIAVAGAGVAVPVLVFRTIGELKVVTYIGVSAVVAVVLAVVVESIMDASNGTTEHVKTDVFLPEGFIPAFSAMSLAFSCHAGLPVVEASMREAKKFPSSFNIAFMLVLVLYLPVAIIGYAIYGDHVYSPILCSLPRDNWVQVAAKVLITMHVLLTYPILMTLFLTELERVIGLAPSVSAYIPKRTALRGFVVGMTVLVAIFVPYFDTMMSLVGALCVVMTTFVLPASFFLKLHAKTARDFVFPILVGALGVLGGSIGAVQATIELVHKVSSGADPNDG